MAGLVAGESRNLSTTWQRAKKAGEESVFLIGLLLAEELLLLEVPEDIALLARGDRALTNFARQAMKRLFSERGGPEDALKTQVDRSILYMSLYRSPYKKVRYFIRMITDPTDVDLVVAGLPDGMLPLYRLVKLLRMMEKYEGPFADGCEDPGAAEEESFQAMAIRQFSGLVPRTMAMLMMNAGYRRSPSSTLWSTYQRF